MSEKSEQKFTTIDFSIVMAFMLLGIQFCWTAIYRYTSTYADIGITYDMMVVVCATLSAVSIILSMMSIRTSAMRFSMTVLFISIMSFVTAFTPIFTGKETQEMAVGFFLVFFCCIAFLKNKELFPFIGVAAILISELLLWLSQGDPYTVEVAGFGIAGAVFVYYSCGLVIFKDMGKDYFRVVSKSLYADEQEFTSGDVFETVSNYFLGILLFIAGLYLLEENMNTTTSLPIMILSVIMMFGSFYGMIRGYIPEGTFSLLVSMYFLCQSAVVIRTGMSDISLFAFILIIPLLILIVIFVKRRDPINFISVALMASYFVAVSVIQYNPSMSYILIIVAVLQMYCSICRIVSVEFGVKLPLHKYL